MTRKWTFEGKDADGNVVFPESLVKISNRPNFVGDMDGIRFVGDFEITQFFESFSEVKLNGESTATANLRLYAGCGDMIEDWSLGEMKVKLMSLSFDDEGVELVALWRVIHNTGIYC